jgi:hypothetical protein
MNSSNRASSNASEEEAQGAVSSPPSEMLAWLMAISKAQLPPAPRVALLHLLEIGKGGVYRSPLTGEWMVWQQVIGLDSPDVRKSLRQWVIEWLCSQEDL